MAATARARCLVLAVLLASIGAGFAQSGGSTGLPSLNFGNFDFSSFFGGSQGEGLTIADPGFTLPGEDLTLTGPGSTFPIPVGGTQPGTVGTGLPFENETNYTYSLSDLSEFEREIQDFEAQFEAEVHGDPVVTGFDGTQFEFAGVAGQAYSFLSTADHSLNVAMVPANISQKEAGGTFIGSAGLVYKGHTVQASVDKRGNMIVLVDDTVISRDTLETSANHAAEFNFGDDDTVVVELFRAGFGLTVRMETPLMVASFYVTPPGLDAYYHEVVRGYLNLALQLKPTADLSQMHGVLGQTVHAKTAKPAGAAAAAVNTITAFTGEGEEADYLVSSLTASDSKFNSFGKPPVRHVRRMLRGLLAHGHATVPLRVASVAPSMMANAAATIN